MRSPKAGRRRSHSTSSSRRLPSHSTFRIFCRTDLMTTPADAAFLYVEETGAVLTCRDDRLMPTSERHKIALRPARPAAFANFDQALRDQPRAAGVIFELKRGWAGQSRLRWAGRALRQGL